MAAKSLATQRLFNQTALLRATHILRKEAYSNYTCTFLYLRIRDGHE